MKKTIYQAPSKYKNKTIKILDLAIELSKFIYIETGKMENKEHFSAGVGTKMRNHSTKVVLNIKTGWFMPSGNKKMKLFEETLTSVEEIKRYMDITIEKVDKIPESWLKIMSLVDSIHPKLIKLLIVAKRKAKQK